MVTSRHQHGVDAAYTTPATRAKWVRLHFLGAPLPNGFPGAQPVKPELPITPQTRTLAAEPCVNCHRNFFPLGYALENFDPLGRWRTHDQVGPVDASGAFVDGTPTNGVVDLRQVLLQIPRGVSNDDHREAARLFAAAGSVAPTSATPDITHPGPADSAQHSEASLVHAHRGGRAMSNAKLDLLQGTLDIMVLQTLDVLGPLHGYGIARRIEQLSGNEILLNQGTIYASLVRLQQRGWIGAKWGVSESNRKAKFYAITKAGKTPDQDRPDAVGAPGSGDGPECWRR